MRLSPLAWGAFALVALLAATAALVGAFTRFDGGAPPVEGEPGFADYEERQYADARLSAVLGIAAAFLLLAMAGCAQQAWRGRTGP